jgi:hypothetical protein
VRAIARNHTRDFSILLEYKIEMPSETRSLWEQLDSDVEPWRRGRAVLISFALVSLLLQGLIFVAAVLDGNIEGLIAFSAVCVLFWLPFYFIWIGVHWIRWIIGTLVGFAGFWALVWGWRDGNWFLLVLAVVNFVIGAYFCLSSSVYFFAKHQQEKRNWPHALIVAAVFGFLLAAFLAGTIGLFGYRAQMQADADEFATQAVVRIYTDQDREWLFAHVPATDLTGSGREKLNRFLKEIARLGPVLQISGATGQLRIIYHFPAQFSFQAQMFADGKSAFGPVRVHLFIVDSGAGWLIAGSSWERTYTESPPSYK